MGNKSKHCSPLVNQEMFNAVKTHACVAVLSFSSGCNKRTKASEKKPEQKNTGSGVGEREKWA